MSRRKPSRRKKNYQSLDDIKADLSYERMAGDPLVEEALDYLANNGTSDAYIDAAMQDAMEYLPRRRAELEAMGASEEELMNLGELTGGNRVVPMPIRRKGELRGNEVRTHVDYDVNPVTGQTEVVPYLDPSNGEVLRTGFGVPRRGMGLPGGHDKGSEYIGENILKLMGINAGVGNKDIVNGQKAFWRSDLVDNDTGKRIDVEVRDNSTLSHSRSIPMSIQQTVVKDD